MNSSGYFGTKDKLPPLISLRAGPVVCTYELGKLRYIYHQDEELLRMVYVAVRDQEWNTIPYSIEKENIVNTQNSFSIRYTALFKQKEVSYRAEVELIGNSDGEISCSLQGTAESDFLRNRIGFCVLHPIDSCVGQPVEITQPDGKTYAGTFPDLISPHQPFLKIAALGWHTRTGFEAQLRFEGDEFETEDQRNWTDHSFKTYSTPLRLVKPVAIKKGDQIWQKVVFQPVSNLPFVSQVKIQCIDITEHGTVPFPALGLARNALTLTPQDISRLHQVPFDHYRYTINLAEVDWIQDFRRVYADARLLFTSLELVVEFGHNVWQELVELVTELTAKSTQISSILVVPLWDGKNSGQFEMVYDVLKKYFPAIPVGYGTQQFFAELNRNRPTHEAFDFVSFSVNPQVHAFDFRTIIENCEAQAYTIHTAQSFVDSTKSIHCSPLTFRVRDSAYAHDPRLHTDFAAAYMLLSLRYLAGVSQLTLFETHGENGLMPAAGDESRRKTFPVFDYLKQIKLFKPTLLGLTHSSNPRCCDCLLLQNEAGEKRYYVINFSTQKCKIRLNESDRILQLLPESISLWDGKEHRVC
ncbi:hypothetical protein [Arundinibacter roseus]|uniref:Uncharacterized protein n=1 Tax=Arundinibacter roseus TaxID=2070510 RepID=A0A4R4JZG9_9BACT|nr:hypothetical protein [Arundinibacter roseus]TDB59546.1 hypothetical protein EZE20_22355 [Arundinibacter roseus]